MITGNGGKVITIPLAPRTPGHNLAIGVSCQRPIFLAADGGRLDRHGAGRIVRRVVCRAGIIKPVGPQTLRYAFVTAALDAGVPLRDVQEPASYADLRDRHALRPGQGLTRPATYIVAAYVPTLAGSPCSSGTVPPGQQSPAGARR